MTGLELEDEVERLLTENNINYTREGVKISYGHKTSKGKYDFELSDKYAIECKVRTTLKKMTIPGINPKTKRPYSNPMIKTHQLRALRRFKGVGYLLLHESDSNTFYALTTQEFDKFLINKDMPRTLEGVTEYEIKLEEFIGGLK